MASKCTPLQAEINDFEGDSPSEISWYKMPDKMQPETPGKERIRSKVQRYFWKVLIPMQFLSMHPPTKEVLNRFFKRAIESRIWDQCNRCKRAYSLNETWPHLQWNVDAVWNLLYTDATSNCLSCYLMLAMVSYLLENKRPPRGSVVNIIPRPEHYETRRMSANKWNIFFYGVQDSAHMARFGAELYSVPRVSLAPPGSYLLNNGQSPESNLWQPRQGPHIARSCSTEAALDRLASISSHCVNTHKSCRSDEVSVLPSRVLDLLEPHRPVLVETRDMQACYTTLSYCWGEADFIKTKRSTLNQRKLGIEWSTLPRTFQEAMRLTVKLGVRYLWIDALYIIQESTEDWEYESGRMCSVYPNSYLTIAATCASNPTEGFLRDRPLAKHVARITIDGSEKDVYFKNAQYHLNGNYSWMNPIENPLLTRGWAYQERQLPRRVLHFTSQETIFKCIESINCECYGLYERQVTVEPDLDPTNDVAIPSASGTNLENILGRWYDETAKFSCLSLTIETDRLPAFSGIAQKYSVYKLGRYLAGTWESSLPESLFWWCDQKPIWPHTRPLSYLAPTWSWVSSLGRHLSASFIKRDVDGERWTCSPCILEVDCVPSGINPFGAVLSGFIRVRGVLKQTTYGEVEHRGYLNNIGYRMRYDYATEGLDEMGPEAEVTLLGLHGIFRGEVAYRGLIIEPSARCVGAYERVGLIMWRPLHPKDVNKLFEGMGLSEVTIV